MKILNLLRNKIKVENKFIGRHQENINLKIFIGEEIPSMELQIAINKDNREKGEIIVDLEKIQKKITSDFFSNHFDVQAVNKDLKELIKKGNENCVLFNEDDLEARIYNIFDDTHKYLEKFIKDTGGDINKFSETFSLLKSFLFLGSVSNYVNLGGILKNESTEQQVWLIINSLYKKNKLIVSALSILPHSPSSQNAKEIKNVAEFLLESKKITENDLKKIDEEIKIGLLQSKENWKE